MTIDHSQERPITWFKPSHRSLPEQAVGAAIFLLISWVSRLASGWFIIASQTEILVPYQILSKSAWIPYHLLAAFSMWMLWRRYSLTILKVELAVFLLQLALLTGWAIGFFYHGPLLALTAMIFLNCSTILATLLFWKKEPLAGQALLPQFFWIFYCLAVNMVICVT